MKTKKPRFAAKILALVLSMLMLLGAMPVAFAATPVKAPVTEWPTISGRTELMYGEPYGVLEISGGKADVPGEFSLAQPTKFSSKLGSGVKVPIYFTPEDLTTYKKTGGSALTTITVVQSTAARIDGSLSATMLKDQKLSEAEFVKSDDFAMMNFNTKHNCTINWENPDKIMDKSGSFEEKVIIASSDKGVDFVKPIEMMITVKVIGSVEEIPELKEAPTASNIKVGQTLADSELSGGLVTKGENPVAGKFVWKDSSIAPKVGTAKYTAVFTPDDPTACDPIETQVSVTTGKGAPEIKAWPEAKGQYKAGGYVDDCVTLTGGEANIPGKFGIDIDYYYKAIPESITEPMDIEIYFVPDDKANYEDVYKTVTVTFEPATPTLGVLIERNYYDRRQTKVNCWIEPEENWNLHTGVFYMVLDGERTDLTKADNYFYFSSADLTPGEHTVYCVYEAGENDVYKDGRSEEEKLTVVGYYNVNVTDYSGTYVAGNYEAGSRNITVTAPEHEKPYYDFSGWTAEGVELTEEELAQQKISFTMPENEVNLTANYKFNFKNFVKYVFEQIGVKLMALVMQGIEWIKGLLP